MVQSEKKTGYGQRIIANVWQTASWFASHNNDWFDYLDYHIADFWTEQNEVSSFRYHSVVSILFSDLLYQTSWTTQNEWFSKYYTVDRQRTNSFFSAPSREHDCLHFGADCTHFRVLVSLVYSSTNIHQPTAFFYQAFVFNFSEILSWYIFLEEICLPTDCSTFVEYHFL